MIHSIRSILASLLGLLLLVGTAHAQGTKKYRIKFDRVRREGDVYTINSLVTLRHHSVSRVEGRVFEKRDSTYSLELVADAQVIRLEQGSKRPVITYTVRRCIGRDGHDTTELLAPGTELYYAFQSGRSVLTASDAGVEESVLNGVKRALLDLNDMANDRDFGVDRAVAVGENWKIKLENIVPVIGRVSGMKIRKENIRAEGKLVSVMESAAHPSMVVQVSADFDDFTGPLPKDFTITDSEAHVRMIGDLPVDPDKGPLSCTLIFDGSATMHGKVGPSLPEVEIEMDATQEVTTEYLYK